MPHLLDTNVLVAVLRDPLGPIAGRLRLLPPDQVFASAVVFFELYYGALRSGRVDHNLAQVEALGLEFLDFTQEDAREAARVRAELAAEGSPIGAYDLLICGQARGRGLTVVTANTREFARVAGLSLEDWADPRDAG